MALLRANPDAFLVIDGTPNLNLLRTGAYPQIPFEREVLAIPRDEAEHGSRSRQIKRLATDQLTERTQNILVVARRKLPPARRFC